MQIIKTNGERRVETGCLKINDDWNGLFVRGDDCVQLLNIFQDIKQKENFLLFGEKEYLSRIIEIIEKEVLL